MIYHFVKKFVGCCLVYAFWQSETTNFKFIAIDEKWAGDLGVGAGSVETREKSRLECGLAFRRLFFYNSFFHLQPSSSSHCVRADHNNNHKLFVNVKFVARPLAMGESQSTKIDERRCQKVKIVNRFWTTWRCLLISIWCHFIKHSSLHAVSSTTKKLMIAWVQHSLLGRDGFAPKIWNVIPFKRIFMHSNRM